MGPLTSLTKSSTGRAAKTKITRQCDAIPLMIWSTPDGHHDYYNQQWYEYHFKGSPHRDDWKAVYPTTCLWHPENGATASTGGATG
jgi:hypothetical protein